MIDALDAIDETDETNGGVQHGRPAVAAAVAVPRELLDPVPREALRDIERDGAARELDRWLRVLGRHEALCRCVFGRLADDGHRLDAFALDDRLRQVLAAQRRIDWQLGRLLHTFLRLRLERALGFRTVAAYARERLGLSPSKVRGLVAVERKTSEAPDFAAPYAAGALSWARAMTLLRVVTERTAAAWTARAQEVTVRRLVAEVEWSLDE